MLIPLLWASLAQAAPSGSAPVDAAVETVDGPVLRAELEVAGEARLIRPDAGISQELRLARGRLQLGLHRIGPASARVAVVPVRTGGDAGYIAIDGESIVPRVQIAEARGDWTPWGRLTVVAGLVDDPWVATGQDLWALRSVGRVLGEDQGWLDRSDLGGHLRFRTPRSWAEVSIGLLSGEGWLARERNEGFNLVTMLSGRPLAGLADDGADWLVVSAMYRDGSRGQALARDHRLGLRVASDHRLVGGGVEFLRGWGLDGDGTLTPQGISAWARTGSDLPVVGYSRFDSARPVHDDPDTAGTVLRVGAGPALGPKEHRTALFALVGIERHGFADDGAAVAGAEAATDSTAFFLQVGTDLAAVASVTPR